MVGMKGTVATTAARQVHSKEALPSRPDDASQEVVREAVRQAVRRAGMGERAASIIADSVIVRSETPDAGNSEKARLLKTGIDEAVRLPMENAKPVETMVKPSVLIQGFLVPADIDEVGESNKPDYTVGTMGDTAHDLNALAANLGFTFEEAAAKLTAAAGRKVSPDPLSRARRVVRNFDYHLAKNPDLPVPREVVDARSFVNRSNYQNRKAKTAKP
jgi:hypothetical protein